MESWLHGLLCLDAASHLPRLPPKLPHPSACELFYVERDTLFSFHKASEAFLQQVCERVCGWGVSVRLWLRVERLLCGSPNAWLHAVHLPDGISSRSIATASCA